MTEYDNEMKFVLFRTNEKHHENSPDYWGKITIKGVEYKLGAWIKESAKGKFFSGTVTAPQEDDYKPEPVDDSTPF